MIRFTYLNHWLLRAFAIALTVLLIASLAAPAFAQDPEPPPPHDPITQIFQYIIQFPTDSLVDALTGAIQAILSKSITPLEQVFSASIAKWVTSSPGIMTPSGGIVDGADVMTPAWTLTSRIAILLWPLTLAITAVIAAKDVVTAGAWGIGNLKQALGTWLIAVIFSASSLYWMDLANRFANATTSAILNLSFVGTAGFDPNLLTSILIGSAITVLGITGLGIIIAILILMVGLSVLAALIFQFIARFAILYVLVALAPVVIMLGVIPPLRWFTYSWLRGFVMVLTIGPINALLLKLIMLLGARGISNDPITAFVDFMAAAGVLSALLTINYTLIRFVFGAIGEVMQRAVGTVTAVGTLALAAAGGVAAAGAAGGAAGAASGGSRLGSVGLGGALGNTRGWSAGLETAGSVLSRSGGFGRGLGAALWGVGSALRNSNGMNGHSNVQPTTNNARTMPKSSSPSQTSPTVETESQSPTPNTESSAPKANNGDGIGTSDNIPAEANSGEFSSQKTTGNGQPTQSARAGSALSSTHSTPSSITSNSSSSSTIGDASAESDLGRLSSMSAQSKNISQGNSLPLVPRTEVHPQANALVQLLDQPLRERVAALTAQYPNPNEQLTAAQAAVAAMSALEVQHGVEPQMLADSWDQTMGPILTSAQAGLPLEAMANDGGYIGDVTQFIGSRVENGLLAAHPSSHEPLFPRAGTPATIPWHPQIAPHDVEVGQQLATMLGAPSTDALNFAHIYHSVRSPETGGGWNAGMQFRQAAQEVTEVERQNRMGALDARLHKMEQQGAVTPNAIRLWRVHLSRTQSMKD